MMRNFGVCYLTKVCLNNLEPKVQHASVTLMRLVCGAEQVK